MRCPYCNHAETGVTDSRDVGERVRRRRECEKCGKRFTTYEGIEEVELVVVKKDGRREKFERRKLEAGVTKACEKRPVSAEAIQKAVDGIERELRNGEGTEVSSKRIGELVMRKLRRLDKVAYIRFASVYREFKDVKSFEEEIKKIKK